MSATAELCTIGQLARRTGVPARTIRFWSDAGLVPPAARSGSGYRLYDADAVARLDLVRTLRELGLARGMRQLPADLPDDPAPEQVEAWVELGELVAAASPEGQAVLGRIVAPGTPTARRARLLEQLETFTDARVERYWQLLAIINGQPVPPTVVPGFEWLIAALRAGLG